MFKIKVKPNKYLPYEVFFILNIGVGQFQTREEANAYIKGMQRGVIDCNKAIQGLIEKGFEPRPDVEE
jgi:hypothetical protein